MKVPNTEKGMRAPPLSPISGMVLTPEMLVALSSSSV